MEKILKSLKSFTNNKDKPKFCVHCGNMATQEAFFDVGDGVIVVEKYCDKCRQQNAKGLTGTCLGERKEKATTRDGL